MVRANALARHLEKLGTLFWVRRPDEGSGGCHTPPGRRIDSTPSRWRQLFDPFLLVRLVALVREEEIDVVVASTVISGLMGLLVARLSGRPFLFDDHNVEHDLLRQQKSPLTRAMATLEGIVCRGADRVSCVSEPDRDLLARTLHVAPERLDVVPNGVNVASRTSPVDPSTMGIPRGRPLALFFGVLDYPPNAEALALLDSELAPRLPGFAFAVLGCGRGPQTHCTNVFRVGFAPDLGPWLAACDVVVVPLQSGSGTRLKILESVAHGVRVVSTSVGARGLRTDLMREALTIVDDWEEFSRTVARMSGLPRPVPSEQFMRHYAWEAIFNRCLRLPSRR